LHGENREGGTRLKVRHAVVCALLGFYLASTSIAPGIRQCTASVAGLISGIRF